jgi:hypothetical protein
VNCNRTTRIAMPSRILQIAFCLALGSVPTSLAQIHYDLTSGIQLASVDVGSKVAPASRYGSTGNFTNQHLALLSVPAPKGDPGFGLSYSMPPSQQSKESELNQPILPSRIRLADLLQITSPHGWRIGEDGILSYRTRDRRCRLVFRYTPDLHTLLEDFNRLDSFSLVCQFSLGKLKPGN